MSQKGYRICWDCKCTVPLHHARSQRINGQQIWRCHKCHVALFQSSMNRALFYLKARTQVWTAKDKGQT